VDLVKKIRLIGRISLRLKYLLRSKKHSKADFLTVPENKIDFIIHEVLEKSLEQNKLNHLIPLLYELKREIEKLTANK
jgi:hypothetical protein